MSWRANEPAGVWSPPLGARGSGVRSGAGPLPPGGTPLRAPVVPPVGVGVVPPEDWESPLGAPVAVPPPPADAPPLAAWDAAGAISRMAMRAARARRMRRVSVARRADSVPHECIQWSALRRAAGGSLLRG